MKQNKLVFVGLFIISTLAGCSSKNNSGFSHVKINLAQTETVYMISSQFQKPKVVEVYKDGREVDVSDNATCAGFNSSSVGEQTITVKYNEYELKYVVCVCDNEFDYFSESLYKYEKSDNSKLSSNTFDQVKTNGYLTTGSDFLTMVIKNEGTTTKYTRGDSYIVDTKGKESYLNDDFTVSDSSDYETQIYDDKVNFYKVTEYKKLDWSDVSKKIVYTEEGVDLNYSVGFAVSDAINAEQMKLISESKDLAYSVETTNFERNIVNNVWHYGYTLTHYQIENGTRYPHTVISYDNKLTLENGKGTRLEQLYTYEEYYGGVKAAYVQVENNVDYTYSQLKDFGSQRIIPYVEVE